MKNSLPILVMLVMLAALPASPAWSQNKGTVQCMENCLEPAIESGDEDVIHEAITHCLAQCNPPEPLGYSKLGSKNSGMSSSSKDECLQICFRKDRQCLKEWGRIPGKCSEKLNKCWKACLQ